MDPEDARSMCCRLRLDNRELRRRGGGLFGSNPLTGSIGVVTLNLPRAAYQAEDVDGFFARISELMRIAYESFEIKRKQLERLTEEGLYPYSRFYLQGIRERSGRYWDNHFSTIGLLGMNEAMLNLIGKGIETTEGKSLSVRTLQFMRSQLEALPGRNRPSLQPRSDAGRRHQLPFGSRGPDALPGYHHCRRCRALLHQLNPAPGWDNG